MDKYNHLTLDFTHPPKQPESYSFHLDDDFFDQVEASELLGGDVDLQLTVSPLTANRFKLTFGYSGVVSVECDRCLAPMELDVESEDYVEVILGSALDDENDEEITLDAQNPVYDFSWIAYELLALSLPSIREHEDISECDPEVVSHLTMDPPAENNAHDPIWAELKEKINKNKNNN
ncbi:DUF177 domain-containing protein [uncultured Porphyromonas sp.]|uniref:YceD family protein n=1 Tax=uncultured Porphyromonas sp. TaxID=159274 RepID=UPI002603F9FE|nr:DUF177 domain-containing protein [uncultured Porphyromonas sp.]